MIFPSILSLFPGAGLLDLGFEQAGFHVFRGPELILGQRIETFTAPRHTFEGVIGGSPCQDFSKARRSPPSGEGNRLLGEFCRVVGAAGPEWFLLENVTGVPNVTVRGYTVQRFNLDARKLGFRQRRLRCFQFGSHDGVPCRFEALPDREGHAEPTCLASEGTKPARRAWPEFCQLQGLPADFDLPWFSTKLKYRLVGNGCHVGVARAIAIAIKHRCDTPSVRLCVCNCGFEAVKGGSHATAACRKRMERRRRDHAGVSDPGRDTAATSR